MHGCGEIHDIRVRRTNPNPHNVVSTGLPSALRVCEFRPLNPHWIHCCSCSSAEERPANDIGPPPQEPQFSGLYSYHILTNTWKCLSERNEGGQDGNSNALLKPRVGHCMLFHSVRVVMDFCLYEVLRFLTYKCVGGFCFAEVS